MNTRNKGSMHCMPTGAWLALCATFLTSAPSPSLCAQRRLSAQNIDFSLPPRLLETKAFVLNAGNAEMAAMVRQQVRGWHLPALLAGLSCSAFTAVHMLCNAFVLWAMTMQAATASSTVESTSLLSVPAHGMPVLTCSPSTLVSHSCRTS